MVMRSFNRITVYLASGVYYYFTPYGRSYTESSELIAREDRAASGRLRRDIIAEKKTFTLAYDIIDSEGLEQFEDLFQKHKDEVLTLEVTKRDQYGMERIDRYSVLMRPFSRQRMVRGLWKGVTVEFVEV